MLAVSLLLYTSIAAGQSYSPAALASAFGLTNTLSLTFPASPITSNGTAGEWIESTSSGWLVTGSFSNPQNVNFVQDPFPQSSPQNQNPSAAPSKTSPTVLSVTYPAGSFSHDTGGTQFSDFYNKTATGGTYQSMLLTYEVAFGPNFQFVKGGKLPGMRGGPQSTSCGSGGKQPDGSDCFSMRVMWRTSGAGEAYAYIPSPNGLCSESNIMCNSDGYGISISRGVFSFTPSNWTRITMLVQLNNPSYANGRLLLYYNDLEAIRQEDLYYRSSTAISSVQGLFFSTFFGGSDDSWATPITQNTYFRNIELWAGTSPSNVTGAQPVKSFSAATSSRSSLGLWSILPGLLVALTVFCF